MAARFWVPVVGIGTGTWDAIDTTHWSATSGGLGGASVPVAGDTVTFDATSLLAAETCTVNTDFSVTSLSIGTMLGTLNFNTNNNSPTMSTFDCVGAGATGAFNAGSGTWTVTGANQVVFNVQGSHLTLTLSNATINFTGVGASLNGGTGTSYGIVSYTGGGAMVTVRQNTFASLSVNSNGVLDSSFTINTGVTVTGTLTITGTNIATSRIRVRPPVIQFQNTISAAVVALTNVDFISMIFAGAATWGGTSIGNGGNNSGTITYTTPVTRYWVGDAGNWSDTAHWSTSSGGASGASVPMCHDSVIFDANSFSLNSQTVACNVIYLGKDIDFSGTTAHPPIWNTSSNVVIFQGSITLAAGMSMTSAGTGITIAPWSPVSITTAGVTMTNFWTIEGGTSAVVSLQDAFSPLVNRFFSITGGTLTTNNFNMLVGSFAASSSNANAKVLNAGTSTITTGTNGAYFSLQGANATVNALSATFICNNTDSATKIFNSGGKSLGAVIFQGSGTGLDSIVGNGSFVSIAFNGTGLTAGTHTTQFASGSVTTILALTVLSSSGATQTLKSSSNGVAWSIFKTTGTVSVDYVKLQDSAAGGGAIFYAGANSTDVSGNSGWLFTASPSNINGYRTIMGVGA